MNLCKWFDSDEVKAASIGGFFTIIGTLVAGALILFTNNVQLKEQVRRDNMLRVVEKSSEILGSLRECSTKSQAEIFQITQAVDQNNLIGDQFSSLESVLRECAEKARSASMFSKMFFSGYTLNTSLFQQATEKLNSRVRNLLKQYTSRRESTNIAANGEIVMEIDDAASAFKKEWNALTYNVDQKIGKEIEDYAERRPLKNH